MWSEDKHDYGTVLLGIFTDKDVSRVRKEIAKLQAEHKLAKSRTDRLIATGAIRGLEILLLRPNQRLYHARLQVEIMSSFPSRRYEFTREVLQMIMSRVRKVAYAPDIERVKEEKPTNQSLVPYRHRYR